MSDPLDSMDLPDELQDVAGRLRGLRPVAPQASEAESMYRAGWQAALAVGAAPTTPSVGNWNKSYLGGLFSGALVSGSLTAALMLGMAKLDSAPDALPTSENVAQQAIEPATDSLVSQNANTHANANANTQHLESDPRSPLNQSAPLVYFASDESMATALLSPVARQQWRKVLTHTPAPYASQGNGADASSMPADEPLRSSPRDLDRTWF